MSGNGHGEKRSRKADLLVAALLTERTIEAAAKAVGIGQATARRWMKDRDFIDQYRVARRESMRQTTARLQVASLAAVEALIGVCEAGESEGARVSAARAILESAWRGIELDDVLVRLEQLESTTKDTEGQINYVYANR